MGFPGSEADIISQAWIDQRMTALGGGLNGSVQHPWLVPNRLFCRNQALGSVS